jgi:uncharacterized protein DUF4038/collagenase-like protein with putative collagen-binding domain
VRKKVRQSLGKTMDRRWVPWALVLVATGCLHEGRLGGGSSAAAPGLAIPAAAFPLKISDDRRCVVDRWGTPFLLQGDAAWSLIAKLKREAAETYLEDRRRRGFNVVLVNLIEHKFADDAPKNAYGQAPFTRKGDFTTPNENYFAQADWVIRRASEKGIAVLLAPAYLGQSGGDEGFYQDMLKSGADAMRRYGHYVGQRYARFDNLIWVLGGDYSPPPEGLKLVRALGEGIRAADGHHLFTAHWSAETSAQDVQDETVRGWLDLNSTYTYGPVYEKSLADYRRPGALPHFLIETAYEHEHDSTPHSLRAQAYYALLTGAVGQIFGSGPIWGFWSWQHELGSKGAVGMTHVRRLFEGRDWAHLVPDDHHEVLTSGLGARGTNDYAVLSRTSDGTLAMAYLPTVRPVTLDLARLRAPIRARWYDPSSGAYIAARSAPAAPSPTTFQPPGCNADGDADWVLVLETAGLLGP